MFEQLTIESIRMPKQIIKYNERSPAHLDLVASIKKFNVIEPITIYKNKTISNGVARFLATKSLGYTTIPCVIIDYPKSEPLRWISDKLCN